MPNPCEPFAFNHCYGPYLIEIRITLPAGYEDRLLPEGEALVKYSEVERTLNQAFDRHPAALRIHQDGGESTVTCGATRVYRPPMADGSMPPIDRWVVRGYVHAELMPVGHRAPLHGLLRAWVDALNTIPLPEGAGDITVEVVGLFTEPPPAYAATVEVVGPFTEPLPAYADGRDVTDT